MLEVTKLTVHHWLQLDRIEEDNVLWQGKTDLSKLPSLSELSDAGLVTTDFPYSFKVLLTDYGWQVAHAYRRFLASEHDSSTDFVPPDRVYTQAELDAEQESAGQLRIPTL